MTAGVELSLDERRRILAEAIHKADMQSWRLISQTDTMATLEKGGKVNHLLHFFVTLLTCGLWVVVWWLCSTMGYRRQKTITVLSNGAIRET
jgi:hypothetical protein